MQNENNNLVKMIKNQCSRFPCTNPVIHAISAKGFTLKSCDKHLGALLTRFNTMHKTTDKDLKVERV
jgi:hypothetical protein